MAASVRARVQQEVLRYVRQAEYRREAARLIAERVAAATDVSRLVFEGVEELEAVLGSVGHAVIREMVPAAIRDARLHASRMGIAPALTDAEATRAVNAALEDVMAESAALATDRLAEIERQFVRLVERVGTDAALAALEGEAGKAFMTMTVALLRQTAGGLIAKVEQEVQRAAVEKADPEAAALFAWQTREDGKECEDRFANSCAPRSGAVQSLRGWKAQGLPGAPNLLCSIYARGDFSWCRCGMHPAGKERIVDAIPRERFSAAIKAGRASAKRDWGEAAA